LALGAGILASVSYLYSDGHWLRSLAVTVLVIFVGLRMGLGAALLFTSRVMYSTLVYGTGAIPSEHDSLEKRPDYKVYQQRTNRFFPGPRKNDL